MQPLSKGSDRIGSIKRQDPGEMRTGNNLQRLFLHIVISSHRGLGCHSY